MSYAAQPLRCLPCQPLLLALGRLPAQQFAAERARFGMVFAGGDKPGHEVRAEQYIGIEAQHPLAARGTNRLVLSGGEADVLFVVDDAPFRFDSDLAKDVARAIL